MQRRRLLPMLLLAACMASACERDRPETIDNGRKDPLAALVEQYGEPVKTYTVRGEVAALPDPDQVGTDFQVHHEAIHDFIGPQGDVVGMGAMRMPFPLAEGATLPEGLQPGDKVSITFAQWLEPRFRWFAYKVERLPADTALTFGPANPPAAIPDEPDSPN